MRANSGGSRYLYEPFDAASARVETLERVSDERWTALETRLASIDAVLDRMERRMWIAVYGLAGVLVAEAAFVTLGRGLTTP